MDYSGGNWTMIPTHSSNLTQSNQDPLFLHQQQHQFLQQQQQQTFQAQTPQSPFQQPQQNLYQQQHQPQRLLQQHQQQPLLQQQPQPQPQPQQNPHQSLASHFHLLHLMENLAEVVEHGNRDQQSDALTVEGQKKKLEESEQLLNQRRDLIANYRKSVEELVKSEP
ncbi:mediator of RNA polymerase II transcription subunit 9-like isoform X2 [Neltuma alba]|uniref:mediator of RNA polymerase II transcription subunit 9-like isoform X2 n=1 Tax=Neltuma alba TaxID=207710 RepID=UPI0010A4F7EB|nr:mediator of RNA polymerase II transcription subunit 9-like isoform X2 [Prosopis alba]